jgi:hypothetical protein
MDVIEKGHQAQRILNDPVFQEAVQAADDQFVYNWRNAPTIEDRERAHAMQAALQAVVQELEVIVGRADMEKARPS